MPADVSEAAGRAVIIDVGALRGDGPARIIMGEPRPAWCDRCMSSSAIRIRFYVLREDTWSESCPMVVWPVGLKYACMVCDPEAFGDLLDDDEPDGDAGALV